ncbi:MAG: hypothetical protein RLZZ33_965 [Pseudomonadota bacterium]
MQQPDEASDLQKSVGRDQQNPGGCAALAELAREIEPQVDQSAVLVAAEQDASADPEQHRQQERPRRGREGEPTHFVQRDRESLGLFSFRHRHIISDEQ